MLPLSLAALVAAAPLPPPPLPPPTPLAREERPERGRTPGYFLHRRGEPRFGGRGGLGVSGRLAGPVPVPAAFALDLFAVGRLSVSRRLPAFTLFPELGYSLTAGLKDTRGHLVSLGVGLGGARRGVAAAVIPRFVAGALLGQRALGVRTGLLIEAVRTGGFGLEISHQATVLPDAVAHALIVTLFVGFYVPTVR